jgi:glycosyltransferase involved in cell wall biosynthesis
LEAQSCGLPIVCFDCETGPSEIVTNNVNGYLIDDFNIDAMVEKLDFLCSNYQKRIEFGKNGSENVAKFSPKVVSQQWEELFEAVFQ